MGVCSVGMNIIINQAMKFKGQVSFIFHDPAKFIDGLRLDEYIKNMYESINREAAGISDPWQRERVKREKVAILDSILGFCVVRQARYENVTCTVGRTQIMKALANKTPTATYMEYSALGTGSGTPAVSDTTLSTELARKTFSLTSQSDNTAEFRSFYTTDDANGTLTEIGHFMDDATGVADSGTLFNHAAISETKTSSLTLTTIFNLTANNG